MCTVKVAIIGNSGVEKTSLRGQYVSGQFLTAYRSTIGTDFITKTLPHHSKPDESVTLQIWVHAVILIFDVNQPETLRALKSWWSEFRACRPLSDEEMEEYCLVETDLAPSSTGSVVSEGAALDFIDELVPLSLRTIVVRHNRDDVGSDGENSIPTFAIPPRTPSIDFHTHHHKHSPKFSLLLNSRVSSTHTRLLPPSLVATSLIIPPNPPLFLTRARLRPPRHSTITDPSTSIAPTITLARYVNNLRTLLQTKPSRPLRGPKLFFTSTKTGAGVSEVFAYVARRVVITVGMGRGSREWA
ncbi:ras-domain-containing protein [Russula emetica]|nr:ras-domain-containing protein [Russula emetica]